MTLVPSQMSEGYAKTLNAVRLAIENRITNATGRMSTTPGFHRGIPDAGAMPDEELSVWLDWVSIEPDEDEPFGAAMLQSRWLISIVGDDQGNDSFGSEVPLVEQAWADITTTLTETSVDIGLDGTCDFTMTPTARKAHGTVSGGDRRVSVVEMDLLARWSMELVRVPPNP